MAFAIFCWRGLLTRVTAVFSVGYYARPCTATFAVPARNGWKKADDRRILPGAAIARDAWRDGDAATGVLTSGTLRS